MENGWIDEEYMDRWRERERNEKMNRCVDGQWIDEERDVLCSCMCPN